jgi:hypothetical protein
MLETSEPSKALGMSKVPLQVLLNPNHDVSESDTGGEVSWRPIGIRPRRRLMKKRPASDSEFFPP